MVAKASTAEAVSTGEADFTAAVASTVEEVMEAGTAKHAA
jgi:hypothetical protein